MNFLDVTLQPRIESKKEEIIEKPRYNWVYENNINYGKNLLDLDNPQEFKYEQWRTNSSLSNFYDNIHIANEMNMNYHLGDKLHYHFLFHIVKKIKRYGKKKTQEDEKREKEAKKELENIRLIQEYYKYNITKAKAALKILTEDQLDYIKKKIKGGMK